MAASIIPFMLARHTKEVLPDAAAKGDDPEAVSWQCQIWLPGIPMTWFLNHISWALEVTKQLPKANVCGMMWYAFKYSPTTCILSHQPFCKRFSLPRLNCCALLPCDWARWALMIAWLQEIRPRAWWSLWVLEMCHDTFNITCNVPYGLGQDENLHGYTCLWSLLESRTTFNTLLHDKEAIADEKNDCKISVPWNLFT